MTNNTPLPEHINTLTIRTYAQNKQTAEEQKIDADIVIVAKFKLNVPYNAAYAVIYDAWVESICFTYTQKKLFYYSRST